MTAIWLRDLVSYALQVMLVVGAGALLAQLFRLRASAAALLYWQTLLGLCLVLPVCQQWSPARFRTVPAETSAATAGPLAGPAQTRTAGPAPAAPIQKWPLEQAVLLLVAGGIVIRTLRLMAGWRRLAHWRRESTACPELDAAFSRTARELGVRAELRISTKAPGPVTFGLWWPVILLPAKLAAMDEETQRAIACHELLHVRRRDWAWCVAEEFVRALLWFHPAIGWLIARIRLTREQVVDKGVLSLTVSRETYVHALIAVAQARLQPSLIPAPLFLRRGLLKKRVAEILEENSMSTRRLALCLAISAGALFLTVRAVTSIFPLKVHAQELSDKPIQVLDSGGKVLRRTVLVYPMRAIERHVEGDVTLDVNVDEHGQVSDARVVSGPEELRRSCLQSVLEWRYDAPDQAPRSTKVVIHFQIPTEGATGELVLPGAPEEGATRDFVYVRNPKNEAELQQMKELEDKLQTLSAPSSDRAETQEDIAKLKKQLEEPESQDTQVIEPDGIERQAADIKAKIAAEGTSPEERASLKKELAERLEQLDSHPFYYVSGDEGPVKGQLSAIHSERVPQASLDDVMSQLNVRIGDIINQEVADRIRKTVSEILGDQFRAVFHSNNDHVELVIVGPPGR